MRYKLIMLLSRIMCILPHSFLLQIGKVLGWVYYTFIKKQRKRAIEQMMASLPVTEDEAKNLVYKSFVNMAQNFLEILYMPKLNEKNFKDYIEIENLERMTDAIAKKRGVVVLTGHIGTWEWLSAAYTLSGLPVTAIAKPQPNEQYTRAINDLRATIGVEIFSRGTSELLAAARALKSGKILGFLADQDAGPGGAFIDFLGRTASTPMGPAVFAYKFKSPIIPSFIVRKPDGKHKVLIYEPLYFEDLGDLDKSLYELTVKMTKILTDVIKEYPTQWLWFQKRWNTPPEKQKDKRHTVSVIEE